MDEQTHSVQESTDMSISSNDDGIEQQNKFNVELKKNHGEAQEDVLLEVQQSSAAKSRSPHLHFDGTGGLGDTMDQS
jgi:hypothetical protein